MAYNNQNGNGGYKGRDSRNGSSRYSGKTWYRDDKRQEENGGERKPYRKSGASYGKNGSSDATGTYRGTGGKSGERYGGRNDSKDDRNRQEGNGYRGKPFRKDNEKDYERKVVRTEEKTVQEPAAQQGGEDALPFLIIGRNAVREAVKSGRSIDKILVTEEQDGSLREITNLAKDAHLIIREVDRKKLDELCMPFGHGGKTANHQGIVAYAAGVEYCSVQEILNLAKAKGEDPFVIVLDGVEDPHNLGSVIRSAECAGAHGVIIGKRRSASVTAAAVKAAAGATAYMKIARVVNVTGALEELKRAGLWVAGADMDGTPMHKQGLNGPLALVIGGEGGGLTKLVRDTCDFLVSIPMQGQINSLNAGVAAGVLMFEKRRQDASAE